MDTVEVRRRFAAYGAGEIPADELRVTIRNSLGQNPLLASAYVALAEAYRRANVIDAGLQSVINSDIAEVTGPRFAKTRIRPPGTAADPRQSHTQVRSAFDSSGPTVFRGTGSVPPPGSTGWQRPPGSTGWQQPPGATGWQQPAAPTGWQGAPPAGSIPDNYYAPRSGHTGFQPAPDPTPGLTGVQATGRTTGGTNGTNGSAWDSVERLTEVAEPLFPGSVLRERFELTEELGRGGMGVVFKAYDRTRAELRDPFVAIKVLNEDFKRHPLAVRALQREARKAQKLAHPNIVTVYDFDRDRGNVYMVMEYLSGRSLDQVINGEARSGMSVKRALEIVRALAAALTYAHEQDIVHSDLKPSNTFITEDNRIKVLDFGIARAAPSQVERGEKTIFDAGQLGAISPAYASLEMLQGGQPDPRDDIYALACVTYELLTGHHPFNRIDAAKAAAQRLQPAPVRGLSRTQWHGLRRGLAFERDARTPTVAEFVKDLTQKSGRPLMWKSLAAAILLVALGVGGTQLALWQNHTLQQRIVASDATTFPQVVSDLHRYPQMFVDWVLADENTSAAFADRFKALTTEAIDHNEYKQADGLLRELRSFMPGSPVAADLARHLDQQKAQQVQALLAERDQAIAKGTLVASQGDRSATELTALILTLDPKNRKSLDPSIASAYARNAASALDANQQDLSKEIVTAGLTLFPDDESLRSLQARSGGRAEPGTETGLPVPDGGDASQLAALLDHPEATQAWESSLNAQLIHLPQADERLARARQVGAHTFVAAAAEARKQKKYDQAADLLATAQGFAPQSDEVKNENDTLNRERGKGSDTRVARSPDQTLKDKIAAETLKDKLIEQGINGDIVGANTTADQLAKLMPGSAFVTHDVPDIQAKAYMNLARHQFAEGHVDLALTTLQAGRRKAPRSQDLEVLQQRYTSAGEFYDTIAGAVTLNVPMKKRALQDLRTVEGEDYADAEKMFAQTLANRIADQRASGRPAVASSLLSAGRELFPEHAALLSQGTAGILINDTSAGAAAVAGAGAGPAAPASSAAVAANPAATAPPTAAPVSTGSSASAASTAELRTPPETNPGVLRTASSAGETAAPAPPSANKLPVSPADVVAPRRTMSNSEGEGAAVAPPAGQDSSAVAQPAASQTPAAQAPVSGASDQSVPPAPPAASPPQSAAATTQQ
jgi:serine/threonine protein kinase